MRISRRAFVRRSAAAALLAPLGGTLLAKQNDGVTLHNGIRLGSPWPPQWQYPPDRPVEPPYLRHRPDVVPIDVGRQLFVDDFLIESTSLKRTWHLPQYHPANPILRPETAWELRDDFNERQNLPTNAAATVFSDGVFFDPRDRLFKMWYMGGYGMFTCLATSVDGISWKRPAFDVRPGTNIVLDHPRDSSTVWLDHEAAEPAHRYKMSIWYDRALSLFASPDGIHWRAAGRSAEVGDRTTFFRNPFRKVWVFSIRANENESSVPGRYRRYWESGNFFDVARGWNGHQPVAWVKSDSHDFARPESPTPPELYALDSVAYESVMLGLFSVWRGEFPSREKINEVTIGFSRDGFHWVRPDRRSFLPVSDAAGSWNWANVQSAGGGCLIVGDRLHFYVSGRQGVPGTDRPGVSSTGLATLRRDGFASMDWLPNDPQPHRASTDPSGAGVLTTRPVRFSGSVLFVNGEFRQRGLRVEVLDSNGTVIEPFSRASCRAITGDGTRLRVDWEKGRLGELAGQVVRFRFVVDDGRLFAFWVSAGESGESRGYVAAGGPQFPGPVDASSTR